MWIRKKTEREREREREREGGREKETLLISFLTITSIHSFFFVPSMISAPRLFVLLLTCLPLLLFPCLFKTSLVVFLFFLPNYCYYSVMTDRFKLYARLVIFILAAILIVVRVINLYC